MLTNADLTIYSRGTTEAWTRLVIRGVLWEHTAALADSVAKNKVVVHISTAGRTLPEIKRRDILVRGVCTKAIGVAGYKMTDLQKDYETATVKAVQRLDYGSNALQHIRIEAE